MLTKLKEPARRILTVLANLLLKAQETEGNIQLAVQEMGNKLEGIETIIPTGTYLFQVLAKMGSKMEPQDHKNLVALTSGYMVSDELDPHKVDPDALLRGVQEEYEKYGTPAFGTFTDDQAVS